MGLVGDGLIYGFSTPPHTNAMVMRVAQNPAHATAPVTSPIESLTLLQKSFGVVDCHVEVAVGRLKVYA